MDVTSYIKSSLQIEVLDNLLFDSHCFDYLSKPEIAFGYLAECLENYGNKPNDNNNIQNKNKEEEAQINEEALDGRFINIYKIYNDIQESIPSVPCLPFSGIPFPFAAYVFLYFNRKMLFFVYFKLHICYVISEFLKKLIYITYYDHSVCVI